MTQRLILLRHASRDNGSNELNSFGEEQAQSRSLYFTKLLENEELKLLSSPKKRCLQTLSPIAKSLKLEVEKLSDLEERRYDEDSRAFEDRIKSFLEKILRERVASLLLCSHSDWLFIAMRDWLDLRISLDEACWTEFERQEDGLWTLKDLVATEHEFKKIFKI